MKLNLLLAEGETATTNPASSWILLVVVGLLIVLMVVRMFADKKRQNQAETMINELKVGDKVVTNSGIYGEIVSIRQTNFGKVALIKSGEGKNASYISVNLQVILGIDEKQDVVLDANGNVVDPVSPKVEEKKETKEEKKEEPTQEEKTETADVKVEETQKAKPATKKPKKKTTSTK